MHSRAYGGTPGGADAPTAAIVINEVFSNASGGGADLVELAVHVVR